MNLSYINNAPLEGVKQLSVDPRRDSKAVQSLVFPQMGSNIHMHSNIHTHIVHALGLGVLHGVKTSYLAGK